MPDRLIVGEDKYDEFLKNATDPDKANYWDVVVNEPRTVRTKMEAPDNVFSLYEMSDGWIGIFHAGRLFHPVPAGYRGGGLEIYGTEGNLIFGNSYEASIISSRKDLLPSVDEHGWYNIPRRGDSSKAKWPQPTPGGFNYYHVSTQHIVDCIIDDRDPIVNVEWGRHITEMMYGAILSSRTGNRYEMTSTTTGLVSEKSRTT
jgi:predicted dehydrogenase